VGKKEKLREQKADFAHHIDEQREADRSIEYLAKKLDLLVARLRDGDQAAAAELVDVYYEQIFRFMRRLGHSCQVSEDLTQESFLQAWQHISQLREGKTLNSWLYRIAGNVSRLYWRRHKGKETVGFDRIDIQDKGEDGSDKTESYEELERLNNAVGRLPIRLKQAIVLHYMQHLTIAQAAEAAGVRQGTFKSRLNRALKVLREQVM